MPTAIRLTDRSRTVADWKCRRSRYFLTEWAGKGIVRASSTVELDFGTDEHDALHQLALRVGEVDVVGDLAPQLYRKVLEREAPRLGEQRAKQLACIAEGSFRGFCAVVWPTLLRDYEIVAVEVECIKTLTPWLKFMARPDLILRSKLTGQLWYIEYKTTSWMDERWLKQWNKAVQTHSGCLAAEETIGEPVEGCIVQGIYKGYVDRKGDGSYRSPYCEGWRYLGGSDVQYSYTYMRSKGWEKFCPIELDGGLAEWIAAFPLDLLEKQFPRTPPIYKRQDLCDNFFRDLIAREAIIRDGVRLLKAAGSQEEADIIMSEVFPQSFDQCTPSFGFDCPYLEACWTPRVGDDPLGSGLYVDREPHHLPEVELFATIEASKEALPQ